ncbi:DUF2971 domain-containing protein [Sphingomonas radiodurans]|uniref:DUF2971 domain-containing protein n=1 Tax=Sphingomonas radiodurans TaxID=2890321 RepID=UPI001E39C441|nr:DUF2971 domain-containing protein [Sphingomonas radiodurans]WBH16032.1 DUF2971 domain-containing protein [Sphingomonas radiodurans]
MPISDHPSFDCPRLNQRLWRYTDFPKFTELLTSRRLWLANAEILAIDDPHEGLQGAVQFPHRMWRSLDEVPDALRKQIVGKGRRKPEETDDHVFAGWFMGEEQRCFMTLSNRRNFFVNCWHAADHESVAMWKIYGSPGAGVAIVSSGGRLHTALEHSSEKIYLGAVKYVDPLTFEIGTPNAFDSLVRKRSSFSYENEVRIVHWQTGRYHDPLSNFDWDESAMRFKNIVEDPRPILPGLALDCDLDTMIEHVIVSPLAPTWYLPMIERLREKLGYNFTISASDLLTAPPTID